MPAGALVAGRADIQLHWASFSVMRAFDGEPEAGVVVPSSLTVTLELTGEQLDLLARRVA